MFCRGIFLLPLLCLACCVSSMPRSARTLLVALPLPDLLSCAGKPAQTMQISETDWILSYDQTRPVQPPVTVSSVLPMGVTPSLTVGASGTCQAVVRIHKGYVAAVHFTGVTLTAMGPTAACVPLIQECVQNPDRTSLPSDYNAGRWLK